jgi:diacylglycerol O-acyltransferase / wax synthase
MVLNSNATSLTPHFFAGMMNHHHPYLLTVSAAIAAAVLYRVVSRMLFEKRPKEPRRRMRATSLGSTKMMVSGVLPNTAKYDSIINLALWYDIRLPKQEVLQKAFVDHVVPHLRFHCIPHQQADCGPVDWVCQRVEVEKHFFLRTAQMRPSLEAEGFAATAEGAVRREVEELLNTTLTTKADGRPWWEVHLIEAPAAPGLPAGSRPPGMVLIRIHHSLGDGVSLMEMFADAVVDDEGTPISQLNLFTPASRGARASFSPLKALKFVGSAVLSVAQILGLATVGSDTPCAFQNSSRQLPYQPNRFTVYFPSHSLALIKKIKDTLTAKGGGHSVTVNDVEFALFAGAIRRFLLRHGEDPSLVHLRALTPFAMMEKMCKETKYQTVLRNFWTFVANDLPLSDTHGIDRVKSSNRTWSRLKSTALIPAAFFLHRLASNLPGVMQKQTSNDLMKRVSVVFSNVPGPQRAMFFGGEEITATHMLYPNVAQQVGVLSINGILHMAMVMSTTHDKGQTRRWLSESFLEELIEVAGAVGVSRMDVMKQVRVV